MTQSFSGAITGLFWLRSVLTPDQVSTLYNETIVHRDSTSSIPADSEVIISWSDILATGSFHGGTIVIGNYYYLIN